jgi:N6-L-threonylcarbamoyladenine synthase
MLRVYHRIRASRPPWSSTCPFARRGLLTLAIETSCDDTCVAILSKPKAGSGGRTELLFNEKITLKNSGKGGIVPVDAIHSHQEHLSSLINKGLRSLPDPDEDIRLARTIWLSDGTPRQKPDFVSVTRGPGSSQALAVGLFEAKGLATAWQIPMVGAHHMQAHALTPRLAHALGRKSPVGLHGRRPEFPFLTLLVSGGHTMLLHSKSLVDHEILATTHDSAIGDALDKCGRAILPASVRRKMPDASYAKYMSEWAFDTPETFASWPIRKWRHEELNKWNNEYGWRMSTPFAESRKLAFSFASIPTQVDRIIEKRTVEGSMDDEERRTLARTALGISFEHLASRTDIALKNLANSKANIRTLIVSGGVASNDFLRFYLRKFFIERGSKYMDIVFPPVELCSDNAAMIAWAATEMFEAGWTTNLNCGPIRKWSMDAASDDGGILGVEGWVAARDGRIVQPRPVTE